MADGATATAEETAPVRQVRRAEAVRPGPHVVRSLQATASTAADVRGVREASAAFKARKVLRGVRRDGTSPAGS